jgi:hypothetical protein
MHCTAVYSVMDEKIRNFYCLKFPRKPSLSECIVMRPKCVKTHVRASLISKIFPELYPGPLLKREEPQEGRGGKGWGGKGREENDRERMGIERERRSERKGGRQGK